MKHHKRSICLIIKNSVKLQLASPYSHGRKQRAIHTWKDYFIARLGITDDSWYIYL